MGSISLEELREWEVFDAIEPIGGARADFHTAYLAYMAAATAPRKRGDKRPQMKDFRIDWWRKKAGGATPEAMANFAMAVTAGMGGEITPEAATAIRGLSNGHEPGPDDGGPGAGHISLQ